MPGSSSTTHKSASDRAAKSVDALSEKGRRTRAGLIVAARRVFERDGFIAARVSDVVHEAGAAHGTFYKYFASKEQIFLAVLETQQGAIEETARAAAAANARTVRDAIEASNRAYIEGYARNWRLMETWAQAAAVQKDIGRLLDELILFNIDRTEHALRRLLDEGAIAEDVDPVLAARALNAMVMQFSIQIFRDGRDDIDIDAAVRTVTDIWCRGIGLDPETPRG